MADLKRRLVQAVSAVTFNSYAEGFKQGTIYRGNLKQFCLPVLNCYSCPGAVGACPIGSLQAVASGISFQFSFYIAGFLMLVGVLAGRMVCGWLCPFGLLQELLNRIPSPKVVLPLWTRYIKYLILLFFVLLLPALATDAYGLGVPYFCKWLCPAGTLEAAIPLSLKNAGIREALGGLFQWRLLWMFLLLALSVVVHRAFCQTLCPLGAVYSLFNQFSFFRIELDRGHCNQCGRCSEVCYLRLPVLAGTNHPECIRCLKCVNNCPTGAMSWEIQYTGKKKEARIHG